MSLLQKAYYRKEYGLEKNVINYRTLNRHRFVGREYSGAEIMLVKELGKLSS